MGNTALKVTYAGCVFVTDPWPVPGYEKYEEALREATESAQAIIASNMPDDNSDIEAVSRKDLPVFTRSRMTADRFSSSGYTDVRILQFGNEMTFCGITLAGTDALHDSSPHISAGHSMGMVFRSEKEKTLYIAGGSVFFDGVSAAISHYAPKVIVLNSDSHSLSDIGSIIMDANDMMEVLYCAHDATVIASHLEALKKAADEHPELRDFFNIYNITGKIVIPEINSETMF